MGSGRNQQPTRAGQVADEEDLRREPVEDVVVGGGAGDAEPSRCALAVDPSAERQGDVACGGAIEGAEELVEEEGLARHGACEREGEVEAGAFPFGEFAGRAGEQGGIGEAGACQDAQGVGGEARKGVHDGAAESDGRDRGGSARASSESTEDGTFTRAAGAGDECDLSWLERGMDVASVREVVGGWSPSAGACDGEPKGGAGAEEARGGADGAWDGADEGGVHERVSAVLTRVVVEGSRDSMCMPIQARWART